ncbi:hypothetical protein GOODEAATRI_015459 [Goodea atripinnis]|uniref:Uncharacterized protein n=1 Tax=Goodea atripinnis TaxID=208336 RepID=A0ABV0MI67_9TELE
MDIPSAFWLLSATPRWNLFENLLKASVVKAHVTCSFSHVLQAKTEKQTHEQIQKKCQNFQSWEIFKHVIIFITVFILCSSFIFFQPTLKDLQKLSQIIFLLSNSHYHYFPNMVHRHNPGLSLLTGFKDHRL